jgi:phosphatidylglycerol:prolipoprotein diacylglycerol transferase
MHPILFYIPVSVKGMYVPIFSYDFFASLALGLGVLLVVIRAKQRDFEQDTMLSALIFGLIFIIIGARLLFVFTYWSYYKVYPDEILKIWYGGLDLYGGYIGGLLFFIVYLYLKHLSLWRFGDILSPSLALGLSIWRIGCFMGGCCFGKPTTLPLGIQFPKGSIAYYQQIEQLLLQPHAPSSLPVQPTELYEVFGGIVLFIMILLLEKRKRYDGQLFWSFTIGYAVLRFIDEFARGDFGRDWIWKPYLSLPQGMSILFIIIALTMMHVLKSSSTVIEKQ